VAFAYLWLEFHKLQSAAVKLNEPLGLGRLCLLIRLWGSLDGSRRFPLQGVSVLITGGELESLTLQFLHFHTKLASPRLPLISFVS